MSWKHRRTFQEIQKKVENHEYEGAEELLTQLITQGSDLSDACLHRAFVRLRMGKGDEALQDIQRTIGLQPESSVAYMIQGEIFLAKQDYLAAYGSLKSAIRLEKDNGRALYHLGRVCAALGKKGEAADYFEGALQFEKDYTLSQFMTEFFNRT